LSLKQGEILKNDRSQQVSSGHKRWLGYLLVVFWSVTVCGVIIVLYNSITGNALISSRSNYAILEMKQKTLSDLKEIGAIPETVIEGFNLTGNITIESEKSLKLLDKSSSDKIKELITSYALARTRYDNEVAHAAKRWSFIVLICYVISLPGFFIGLKYLRSK
jgi:hypothetical protein